MNLMNIANYIEEQGYARKGKDLFIHHMPESVTKGVFLLNSLTGTLIDHELPGYKKTSFQIIVRDTDIGTGEALAKELMTVLDLKAQELGSIHVNYMRPRHEPVTYPSSEGSILETSVNYDICYYEKLV